MTNATHSATDVATARTRLAHAHADLDVAVGALSILDGDNAMATPALIALLLSASQARRHLNGLEHLLSMQIVAAR
jgi:hypothetical protein